MKKKMLGCRIRSTSYKTADRPGISYGGIPGTSYGFIQFKSSLCVGGDNENNVSLFSSNNCFKTCGWCIREFALSMTKNINMLEVFVLVVAEQLIRTKYFCAGADADAAAIHNNS